MQRGVDLFLGLLFAVAAAVQLNDPDPLAWVVLYGAVAVLAGLAFFGRENLWLALAVAGACLVAMVLAAPGFFTFLGQDTYGLTAEMTDRAPFVEQAREFLGAALALAGALFYAWRARRRTASSVR